MDSIRRPGLGKPHMHTSRIHVKIEKEYKDALRKCAEHSGIEMSTIVRCAALWAIGYDECSFIVAYLRNLCEEGRPVGEKPARVLRL